MVQARVMVLLAVIVYSFPVLLVWGCVAVRQSWCVAVDDDVDLDDGRDDDMRYSLL